MIEFRMCADCTFAAGFGLCASCVHNRDTIRELQNREIRLELRLGPTDMNPDDDYVIYLTLIDGEPELRGPHQSMIERGPSTSGGYEHDITAEGIYIEHVGEEGDPTRVEIARHEVETEARAELTWELNVCT